MAARVLQRLRSGVPAEQLKNPFEPRAALIYRLIAGQLVAALALQWITGFRLPLGTLADLPFWPLFLCPSGMAARRYGHERLGGWMEATALIYGQGVSILLVLIPLTAISGPFADSGLAAVDRALGLNWPLFVKEFEKSDKATTAIVLFYNSFRWQPALVLSILFLLRQENRAWMTVAAGVIAAVITAAIYPFTPALGAYTYFHVSPAAVPRFAAGWNFAPVLQAIKAGGARTETPQMFTGLVSFPSYHAAAAAIFVWAVWPLPKIRVVFVLLNARMAVSAVVAGGHYLIDIVGGLAVAAISIRFAICRISSRKITPECDDDKSRSPASTEADTAATRTR